MWLNLISLLLVLAVTFVQSIFGLFSGLISAFCSIFAAVVAFGYYEAVNDFATKQIGLHPAYSEPISLILLFIIVLTGLRYAADNLIRGNVVVPQYMDWIGGGICGFVSAQICVGMAVISTLMLPLGGTVLGFTRYDRTEENSTEHQGMVKWERNVLWTRCDEFTANLVSILSGGSFSTGSTALAAVYPDFMDAVFYSTNTVQNISTPSPFRDKDDGFKNGLKVYEWWDQSTPVEGRYRKGVPDLKNPVPQIDRVTFSPAAGKRLLGVRLALQPAAADRNKNQRIHLFRPSMIKLVGKNGDSYEQYPARIVGNIDDKIEYGNRIADLDNNFSVGGDSGDQYADVYFEVSDGFTPFFAEYRRHARTAMPAQKSKTPPVVALKGGKPPEGTAAAAAAENAANNSKPGLMFGTVMEYPYGDVWGIPVALSPSKTKKADCQVEGEEFAGGRIFGEKARLEPDPGEAGKVERFKLPAGYRVCQIHYKPKKALTVAGQVFAFVGQLQQFQALDDRGNICEMAGYWVKIKRGNTDYYEIFYNGSPDHKVDETFKYMLDTKSVEQKEIRDQDDAEVCLLFWTKPGVKVVKVQNAQGNGAEVSIAMQDNPAP